MRLYFIALQFLTIIPIPFSFRFREGDLGRSMSLFPLVGLTLGVLLAGCDYLAGSDSFPVPSRIFFYWSCCRWLPVPCIWMGWLMSATAWRQGGTGEVSAGDEGFLHRGRGCGGTGAGAAP